MSYFDWQDIVKHFGSMTYEAGSRTAEAIDALTDDLGMAYVPSDLPDTIREDWAERVQAAADAGVPALLARLDHPDPEMRRIVTFVLAYMDGEEELAAALRARLDTESDPAAKVGLLVALARHPGEHAFLRALTAAAHPAVTRFGAAFGLVLQRKEWFGNDKDVTSGGDLDDQTIDALTLFVRDEVEEPLCELAWAEPEWNSTFHAVSDLLRWIPDAETRWAARMLDLLRSGECSNEWAGSCCWKAIKGVHPQHPLAGPLGRQVADLLTHPDPTLRKAALGNIGAWIRDSDGPAAAGYVDRVAAALSDPNLSAVALDVLVECGDERCVPGLRRMLALPIDEAAEKLLSGAAPFAEALMPAVRARLVKGIDQFELRRLLNAITTWGEPVRAALPELTAMITTTHSHESWDQNVMRLCMAIGRLGAPAAEPATVEALRSVATGPSLHQRLWAISALKAIGHPTDHIVTLLLGVIADNPARSPEPGVRVSTFTDAMACDDLCRLGPRAGRAEPALRALLDEGGETAGIRSKVAWTLWEVTHDAQTAVQVLLEQIDVVDRPEHELNYLSWMGAAAESALTVLDVLREGMGATARQAGLTAAAIRRAIHEAPRQTGAEAESLAGIEATADTSGGTCGARPPGGRTPDNVPRHNHALDESNE
ncbi:hypothetical protein [Microtetraspora glauca]|uniref:HEAT repeat domain-containing protein n=1 Tax=Microtetraspora glauca TaxID=1996 RepID=A0ABV3G9M8_MICGL